MELFRIKKKLNTKWIEEILLKNASLAGIGLLTPKTVLAADFFYDFPVVRTPQSSRKFTNPAIERRLLMLLVKGEE